jgi:hypothetical protein
MKKEFIFILIVVAASCAPSAKTLPEEELVITRKYVGDFVEFRNTQPARFGDPHLIWIRTNLEASYGEISAYSKTCDFKPGERLYIRRMYSSRGGMWGDWTYTIESDSLKKNYILSQFKYGDKILVQSWF